MTTYTYSTVSIYYYLVKKSKAQRRSARPVSIPGALTFNQLVRLEAEGKLTAFAQRAHLFANHTGAKTSVSKGFDLGHIAIALCHLNINTIVGRISNYTGPLCHNYSTLCALSMTQKQDIVLM